MIVVIITATEPCLLSTEDFCDRRLITASQVFPLIFLVNAYELYLHRYLIVVVASSLACLLH